MDRHKFNDKAVMVAFLLMTVGLVLTVVGFMVWAIIDGASGAAAAFSFMLPFLGAMVFLVLRDLVCDVS